MLLCTAAAVDDELGETLLPLLFGRLAVNGCIDADDHFRCSVPCSAAAAPPLAGDVPTGGDVVPLRCPLLTIETSPSPSP